MTLARALCAVPLPAPTVDFRLRGTAAGKAWFRRWHLQFNGLLLARYPEHFLRHTVGHEVAHLVAMAAFGAHIRPHGPEWRSVMAHFSLPPDVTHSYDVTGISRRRSPFVYRCGCPEPVCFGAMRHRRSGNGVGYFCRRCDQRLVYSHQL